MTKDLSRWVGRDDHGGLPSLERPDAPRAEHWILEAVAAVERPHDPVVSRDGSMIAFILDRDTSDVWTVPVAGGSPSRVTTDRDLVPYWEDDAPSWSPDGKRLAYSDRGWVCVVAASGGRPRRIAEATAPKWIDDETLVITAERDATGRLARVSVSDPWPVALTPPDQDPTAASPSPDAKSLLYVSHPRKDRNRSDIHALDLGSGTTRLLAGEPGIQARGPRLSPDGSTIAFTSEGPGWYEVHLVGFDGSGERQLTSADADFTGLAWHRDGRRLLAVSTRHGRGDLVSIDAVTGEVTVLAAGGEWSSPQWAGESVVAIHEDHRTPPRLVRVDVDGTVDRLTGPPPAPVSAAPHLPFEEVRYRSRDGREIHGFLFRPRAASRGSVPAIVYPHGGPTSAYMDAWDGHAQYFLDKGYAWFAINFRGSTGYGREFERANHGTWGVDDTDDCLAAADHLAGLEWIDETRIGIFGASYGSYLALASLARDPGYRFACGVAKYGDSDIATSWAQGDRGGREDLERMMGTPSENPAGYRAGSPLWMVGEIQRPLLVAHGERDARVHPDQSAQLVAELRRLDKTFEYLTYPTEAHGFLRAGPQVHFYRRMERFLDWHLR